MLAQPTSDVLACSSSDTANHSVQMPQTDELQVNFSNVKETTTIKTQTTTGQGVSRRDFRQRLRLAGAGTSPDSGIVTWKPNAKRPVEWFPVPARHVIRIDPSHVEATTAADIHEIKLMDLRRTQSEGGDGYPSEQHEPRWNKRNSQLPPNSVDRAHQVHTERSDVVGATLGLQCSASKTAGPSCLQPEGTGTAFREAFEESSSLRSLETKPVTGTTTREISRGESLSANDSPPAIDQQKTAGAKKRRNNKICPRATLGQSDTGFSIDRSQLLVQTFPWSGCARSSSAPGVVIRAERQRGVRATAIPCSVATGHWNTRHAKPGLRERIRPRTTWSRKSNTPELLVHQTSLSKVAPHQGCREGGAARASGAPATLNASATASGTSSINTSDRRRKCSRHVLSRGRATTANASGCARELDVVCVQGRFPACDDGSSTRRRRSGNSGKNGRRRSNDGRVDLRRPTRESTKSERVVTNTVPFRRTDKQTPSHSDEEALADLDSLSFSSGSYCGWSAGGAAV